MVHCGLHTYTQMYMVTASSRVHSSSTRPFMQHVYGHMMHACTHTYMHGQRMFNGPLNTYTYVHGFHRFDGPLIACTSIFLVSSLVKNATADTTTDHPSSQSNVSGPQVVKGRTPAVAASLPTMKKPAKKSLKNANTAQLDDRHVDDVSHASSTRDSSNHAQTSHRDIIAPSVVNASQDSVHSSYVYVDQPRKRQMDAQSMPQRQIRAKNQQVHVQDFAGKLKENAGDDQQQKSSMTGDGVGGGKVQEFDQYKYQARRKV